MAKLEDLFESGWYKELDDHLHSQAFREIGQTLHNISKSRIPMTPKFEDMFRAFKECSWSSLHTVLIGQDPYPGKVDEKNYVADGLAFSSRNSKTIPKSLNYIYEALEKDFEVPYENAENFDLTRWAKQGILLLNCALTLPQSVNTKSGAHVLLWSPFITYVLKTINERKDSIAFGLFGNYAKTYRKLLTNDTFAIYECEHPAAAAYRKGKWNHDRIFAAVNEFQKFKNNIHIEW